MADAEEQWHKDYSKTEDLTTLHKDVEFELRTYGIPARQTMKGKAEILQRWLVEALPYCHSIVVEPDGRGRYLYYDVRVLLDVWPEKALAICVRVEERVVAGARYPIQYVAIAVANRISDGLTKDVGL